MLRNSMRTMRSMALWKWIAFGAMALVLFLGAGALAGQEQVFAADDDIASGSYGDTTWVIDANGKLTVTSALTAVDLSGLDTSSVTNMDAMFFGCDGLKELDVTLSGPRLRR